MSARQLPPPALTYRDLRGQPTNKQVTTGAWDLRNLKFNTSAALGPFAVASFDRPDGTAGAGPDSEISVEVNQKLFNSRMYARAIMRVSKGKVQPAMDVRPADLVTVICLLGLLLM